MADGGGAADGADVPAVHVFHDNGPQETTHKVWSQCLTAGLVAVAETARRLSPTLFAAAPEFLSFDWPYIALFLVGPAANAVEMGMNAGNAT